MPLNRFEADGNTYAFPTNVGAYSDNFGDVVVRNTRLPGVDGGFDEYLSDPAARELGSIRQGFTLQSDTKEGLDTLRDNVRAMLLWGKGYLYYRPTNYPTDGERRCWCRLSNLQMPRDDSMANYWQRVTAIFSASAPIWEAVGSASVDTINHTGTQTDGTVNNGGNAIALPTVRIACGAGQAMTGPIYIRRMDGTDVVDEVKYTYNLTANTYLEFDANEWRVTYNDGSDQDAYDKTFDFLHPDWLRLMPGDNTIRVVSGDAGDVATVTVTYRDTWY